VSRVQLLGTGSADGWPNPFCRCASCAALRRRGEVRGHTAVLVDGTVLVDLGPEVPRAAERHGADLGGVRLVLLTHAHPDHVGPLALLMRHWAGPRDPLVVAGPPVALDLCRDWLAPDGGVHLHPLADGDVLEHGGYRVEALAARHDGPEAGPALVYRVTTPDGTRLLHATDTGPLPEPTHRALAGVALDVVLLELTFGDRHDHGTDHLDLQTFPVELARLRRSGAVTPSSRVAAVHLSHHNPPDLADRLLPWGCALLPDGAELCTGADGDRPAGFAGARPRRSLVLGGARSGKSRHAEQLVAAAPDVTYVATGGDRADDPEWTTRVAAHQARRPAHWRTVVTTDVEPLLAGAADGEVLVVDCLTLWLAAVLDAADSWDDLALAAKRARPRIDALVEAWRATRAHVVAVSNEVGWGVVPATGSGRLFQDLQGQLNARLARHSDDVHLVVAGRVLDLGRLDGGWR
jgi:adenosylcobinamide kinase/adenosylcobinamide-phosphate guanylyltransferase